MATIQTYASPLLYDKIAQELNTELDGTFDDQYPVCFTRTEGDETVPEIYLNDGEKINLRVMPNKTRSMSFFTVEGDMSELDEMHYSIPMAITCWVNLQEYDNSKSYDYTAELIRDVTTILRKYGCYDFNVNVNDPFEGFSMLDKERNANIMRPMTAFKITFTKNEQVCET